MKNTGTIHTIKTEDFFWELKKNQLLAAVYEKDFQTAEQIYIDIIKCAECRSKFSENSEKLLNQIQTIFRKFKPTLLKNCTPMVIECNTRLKNLILNSIKQSPGNIHYVNFLPWELKLGLSHCQKDLLYKTAMTFQLTSGCSNFCRRCNEWALPKIRSHFSYQAILKILKQMARQKNDEVSLYGASDPLDWTDDGKDIIDILEYLEKLPLEYSLLTKVPKNKEPLLKKLLRINSNLSVSITSKNKNRIRKIEREIGEPISRQHDLEELLIPARLDEDFASIKPSITDGYGTELTPDGAFIIIPTFTSALHPFGHKKIRVTSETKFFPVKKNGRNALLVDYFKPIEGYNLKKNRYYLKFLLDVQIESIILDNGTDELTPPGMRSLKEYLSIFEETARLQRKKMTSSVRKRLKKQFMADKNLYLKKINAHLDLCERQGCLSSKLSAVSYFLMSLSGYIKKNSVKIKIMRFLLKNEMECILNTYADPITASPLGDLLSAADIDSFDLLRYCVFCLMNKSNDSTVLEFIRTYPSVYDPVADIFVQYSPSD